MPPARTGDIGIFNRSHYEEVLVVRVHPENLDRQRLPEGAKGKDLWERRDGAEAQIPAEHVVVGDVVLIAAGDEVPADGRIIAASALQIDESALTRESTPAAKDAQTLAGENTVPGRTHPPRGEESMARRRHD